MLMWAMARIVAAEQSQACARSSSRFNIDCSAIVQVKLVIQDRERDVQKSQYLVSNLEVIGQDEFTMLWKAKREGEKVDNKSFLY